MRILTNGVKDHIGKEVTISGWVHKLRKLGGISFLVVRDRKGLIQAVIEKASENIKIKDLTTETVLEITGKVVKEDRAPQGAEIKVEKVNIISPVTEDVPVSLNKKELNVNIDTLLDNRPLTLRALKQQAIFRIQNTILSTFREYLSSLDFTEITTPKIVKSGMETGGAEMFQVDYFKQKAYLSQSPQMYKQIMVGVFERVFETAFVYRAEKHNTARHLNEYYSLDFEMGFIETYEEIIDVEEGYLRFMLERLEKSNLDDFNYFNVEIPKLPKRMPRIKLTEAQEILEKEYKEKCVGAPDLDPKQEKLICEYAKSKLDSEFIFITHYPSRKRPFYAYDDPKNKEYTLSFDLLFRGLEVTTGGQRIHIYDDYLEKMKARKMKVEDFSDYLSVFKYGMPPHGGLAIGLERLTSRLLGLENIRDGSLFPRDINRLRP